MFTSIRDYNKHKEEYDRAITKVMETGKFIMGEEILELESRLQDYTGINHCITTSSGTDSLLMSLMALGIKMGDKVITVSFTWVSTVETIVLLGAIPIFVDIDPITYNMSFESLRSALGEDIKCIIPVDLYGKSIDYERINKLAADYNVPIILDAAQSFGTFNGDVLNNNKSIKVICTSFFPTKPLGCYGDGGAIFTNDKVIANKIKSIRSHGKDENGHHTSIGINGRLDTIQAAILLVKLKYIKESLAKRRENAFRYTNAFRNLKWLKTPGMSDSDHVYGQYTIRLLCDRLEHFKLYLRNNNVPCKTYYERPVHLEPMYKMGDVYLEETELACKRVVSIPVYPELSEDELCHYISVIMDYDGVI